MDPIYCIAYILKYGFKGHKQVARFHSCLIPGINILKGDIEELTKCEYITGTRKKKCITALKRDQCK